MASRARAGALGPTSIAGKTLEIESYSINRDEKSGKKFTLFEITVTEDSERGMEPTSYRIYRRYNHFYFLNKQLSRFRTHNAARLPGKKWFGNLDPSFLSKRQQGLQEFFEAVLTNTDTARSRELTIFLAERLDDAIRSGNMSEEEVNDLRAISKFELDELRAIFQRLSMENKERRLDQKQFSEIMAEMGVTDSSNQLLFNALDSDGSGTIELRELLVGLSALISKDMDSKATFLFSIFDIDGNGTISKDEVLAIVMTLDKLALNIVGSSQSAAGAGSARAKKQKRKSSAISSQALTVVEEVFKKLDVNEDGVLQLEEFIEGIKVFPDLFDATSAFFADDVDSVEEERKKK